VNVFAGFHYATLSMRTFAFIWSAAATPPL